MAQSKKHTLSSFECHISKHGFRGGPSISHHSRYEKDHSGTTRNYNNEERHLSQIGLYRSHYGSHYGSYQGGYPKSHHEDTFMSCQGTPHISSYRSQQRSPSAHEGSALREENQASIGYLYGVGNVHSSHKHGNYRTKSVDQHKRKNDGLFHINEKETMQRLNDRLASYMEKVRSLEQENAQMENNINGWYAKNSPRSLPDLSQYFTTIKEMQAQIAETTVTNSNAALQIDNAKWAADDFKNKYEIELKLKDSVERDVKGLCQALGWFKTETSDLDIQFQNLFEENQEMKINHEQEVNALKSQLGQRVNVEVNAAPSKDLNKTLEEIRQQYENLMDRNLKEVENIFLARTEELNNQVASSTEQLQSEQIAIIDLKRQIQTLEIDLESQMSMNITLQDSLAETKATYSSQLNQQQKVIDQMEAELSSVRFDLERHNSDYRKLMDQKTHLEMEIATYKSLLEGHTLQDKKEKVVHLIADVIISTDNNDSKPNSNLLEGNQGSRNTDGRHSTELAQESKTEE